MDTLISDPTKLQNLLVPEKWITAIRLRKRLVDNLFDTSYEKNTITRGVKIKLTSDGPIPARVYSLPNIHKALVASLS